jgi:hypothetical protein
VAQRRTRVYVAAPLTCGPVLDNIRTAILTGTELLDLGYAPFVPHLSAFWDIVEPLCYEDWLAHDLEWLAVCDAVLRLPGESPGADREVACARERGLPVYHDLPALLREVPARREEG